MERPPIRLRHSWSRGEHSGNRSRERLRQLQRSAIDSLPYRPSAGEARGHYHHRRDDSADPVHRRRRGNSGRESMTSAGGLTGASEVAVAGTSVAARSRGRLRESPSRARAPRSTTRKRAGRDHQALHEDEYGRRPGRTGNALRRSPRRGRRGVGARAPPGGTGPDARLMRGPIAREAALSADPSRACPLDLDGRRPGFTLIWDPGCDLAPTAWPLSSPSSSPRGLASIAVARGKARSAHPPPSCSFTSTPETVLCGRRYALGCRRSLLGASAVGVGATVVAGDYLYVADGEVAPTRAGPGVASQACGQRASSRWVPPKDGELTILEARIAYERAAVHRLGIESIVALLVGGTLPAGGRMTCVRTASRPTARNLRGACSRRAPGSAFAIESALDELASKLGLDPPRAADAEPRRRGRQAPRRKAAAAARRRRMPRSACATTRCGGQWLISDGEGVGLAGASSQASATCRLDDDGGLTDCDRRRRHERRRVRASRSSRPRSSVCRGTACGS